MNQADSTFPRCTDCGKRLVENQIALCESCSAKKTIVPSGSGTQEDSPTIPPIGTADSGFRFSSNETEQGLARYTNRKEIGRWEHGLVYAAHHDGLDRQVVIRVLDCTKNNNSEIKHEFLQRAKAISKLNHRNTVSTMEAGVDGESAYFVHEHVDGLEITDLQPRSAQQRRCEGFFPAAQIAKHMHCAASGLQAIHDQGIAHGNLSPNSFVLDKNGTLKIVGLADPSVPQSVESVELNSVSGDIHHLGAAFYKFTTGNELQPFVLAQSAAHIARHLKKHNPGLRQDFCKVVARCLTQQDDVYTNCKQINDDLVGLIDQRTTRASWRTRIYSLLLGLLLGNAIVLIFANAFSKLLPESISGGVQILLGFGLVIVYSILMETVFGFTLFRRLFGLKIYDHSGDEAHWIRRLARASIRMGVIFAAIFSGALILPLLSTFASATAGIVLTVTIGITFFPLWILYVPARFIKCRWTYYDLWAGATWGEFESRKLSSELQTSSQFIADQPVGEPIHEIDQFEIYESLGSGGMGNVFLGHDKTLHRNVAIKVLAGHLIDDAETRSRFQREARLASKISHPNVARIFGDGIWNDSPYIAMELVEGQDLHETVKSNGAMNVETAWHCIIQVAEALQAATKMGVIHRDIKPANLMLTSDKTIKVMDFGISREIHSDVAVTQVGSVIGTPTYMSPEQAMGNEVDFRSDLYSLGLTLYFLLAGRAPFNGKNSMQILAQKMDSSPAPLLGEIPDLTPDQQLVIDKMIAKNPDDRFADYDTLLLELNRNYSGDQQLARPTKRIAAEVCNLFAFYLFGAIALVMVSAIFGLKTGQPNSLAMSSVLLSVQAMFIGMYIGGIATRGTTSGKKLLGLKVTRCNGQPIGFARAALRFLVAYPAAITYPIVPVATLLGFPSVDLGLIPNVLMTVNALLIVVSFILMIKHPKRQTLHDRAADTVVHQAKN